MKGISNSNPNTIVDHAGNPLDDEPSLQFTNGLKATDESANEKVVIGVNTDFEEASTRTNINSGDAFSTILGKIKKWFSDLKTVAFSGSYNDLSDKPTIPTVNNGTLTIQKNGTNQGTFTANQSNNTTVNIEVPAAANNGTLTIQKNGTNVATFTANQSGNTTANIEVPAAANNGTLTIKQDGTQKGTFTANSNSNVTIELTDTNTTYSANNGVGLSGTTFYNSGVRAVSINGNYLRVNTNGTNADLTIPYATYCNLANMATEAEKASKDVNGNYIVSNYMRTNGGRMSDGAIITLPSTKSGYSSCDRLRLADSIIFYGYNHTTDNASGSYIVNSSENSPNIDINADHIYFYQVNQNGLTKTICVFDAAGNTTNINSFRNYMNLRADDGITCFKTSSDVLVNINAANVESSVRFKENIKDISEDEAKKLLDVRPITFDFKEKYAPNERERYGQAGVIAEEVLDIYPNLVRYSNIDTEDGEEVPTFVEYSHFAPYLIKLAQMQQKEIDELKSIVANQQKEIDELKKNNV